MDFAARQLQEKCMEQQQDLFMTFVDLTKTFDSVRKNGLWKILAKFGCPEKFVKISSLLYDGMVTRVLDDGGSSEPFQVTNGVKQECVLAPALYSLVFSAMLTEALNHSSSGIPITYRCDGKLFNLRRLQAITKIEEISIINLLFADDCTLKAITEHQIQRELDQFSSSWENFGLNINTKKTDVMYQPAPKSPYNELHISVKKQRLKAVENFTYLGSILSRCANIDDEVKNRITEASWAFGNLKKKVLEERRISQSTKVKVYKAVVLTILLYGCETWAICKRHEKQLQQYHTRRLRRILNIRWNDMIPNTDVLERANLSSVVTMIRKAQMRWAGYVSRMADSRIPKQLFYGLLKNGQKKLKLHANAIKTP